MRVSEQAALVLMNESAKNYADLAAAREEICRAVREKFGYELQQEPMEIGNRGSKADGGDDAASGGGGGSSRGEA